ncbi:MAG: hypothetical protein M3430_00165 [Acidobacteriota bacterium]|nr:hypothetical protein [Acidobacteriota bacterium]
MDTISNRLNYAQETFDELLNALESLRRATKAIVEPTIPTLISPKDRPQDAYSVLDEVYVLQELVKELATDMTLAEQAYAEETAATRRLFRPELQECPSLVNTGIINDIKGSMAWMLTAQGCTRAIRQRLAKSAPPKQHEVKLLVRQVSSLFGMTEESRFDPKPPVEKNKSAVAVEAQHDVHALSAA